VPYQILFTPEVVFLEGYFFLGGVGVNEKGSKGKKVLLQDM
jgi:hypothetical protein